MADDVLSVVGGGVGVAAGVGVLARYVWENVKSRKEKLEEQAESRTEMKLDALVAGQTRVELDLRDLRNAISNQAGVIAGVKERVEGVATDYGPRIKSLELWRAGIDGKRVRK